MHALDQCTPGKTKTHNKLGAIRMFTDIEGDLTHVFKCKLLVVCQGLSKGANCLAYQRPRMLIRKSTNMVTATKCAHATTSSCKSTTVQCTDRYPGETFHLVAERGSHCSGSAARRALGRRHNILLHQLSNDGRVMCTVVCGCV